MEGAITAAFNAAGAGGIEGIASGSARELFRHTMRQSVTSTWLAGAKEFARGTLGEVGEEVLIEALDTAFVRMSLRPDMTVGEFFKSLHDTALVTAFTSAPYSAIHGAAAVRDVKVMDVHGRRVMKDVRGMDSGIKQADTADATQGRMEPGDTPGPDGTIVENAAAVADAAGSTVGAAVPTTDDVALPGAVTAAENGGTSAPMLSAGVFDTFTRTGADPDARVPDSEKVHRNITILRPRTAGKGVPLDISSEEAAPFREEFDRDHRAVDGFEVRKEFIPAATEAEARAEYARRHGHANPRPDWKTKPASAWIDTDGGTMVFRDAQQRDGWRQDQIAHAYLNANRGGNGPTESARLNYEEAAKDHPFLEIIASIPHDSASYDIGSGNFTINTTQGGRSTKLEGIVRGKGIHIVGLFPRGKKANTVGSNSMGSDFLVTVLAYSRQMPGMVITANAARNDARNMNGYAMWPKLGFEARNPADLARIIGKRGIPKQDTARMRELADTGNGTPSLIKLNSTKEGQLLWRKHGDSIDVHFDATPGSLILEDLRDQMTRRFRRSQSRKSKPVAPPELQSE